MTITYTATIYEGQSYTIAFPSAPIGTENQTVNRYTWNLEAGLTADVVYDYKYDGFSGFVTQDTVTSAKVVTYADNVAEGDEYFQYVYDLSWQTPPGYGLGGEKYVWMFTLKDAKNQTGTAAANTMNGTPGSDKLNGGGGNDRLTGGAGEDRLTGGSGADKFVFAEAGSANADTITDFQPGVDKILLDNAFFQKLGATTGPLKAAMFWKGTAAHDTSDRIIYDPDNGKLYYDPDGTGGQAKTLIATLSGSPNAVSAGDFTVN